MSNTHIGFESLITKLHFKKKFIKIELLVLKLQTFERKMGDISHRVTSLKNFKFTTKKQKFISAWDFELFFLRQKKFFSSKCQKANDWVFEKKLMKFKY
jgi:hypothetical protein